MDDNIVKFSQSYCNYQIITKLNMLKEIPLYLAGEKMFNNPCCRKTSEQSMSSGCRFTKH